MKKKQFLNAADVAAFMGVSVQTAYKSICRLNDELSSQGFVTVAGKVSRSYFEKKVHCGMQEASDASEQA